MAAAYADHGAEVLVVTCTGGERGSILVDEVRQMPRAHRDLTGLRREEMKSAEEEIEGDDALREAPSGAANGAAIPLEELEEGGRTMPADGVRHVRSRSQSQPTSQAHAIVEKSRNYCSMMLGPHFTQAFVLTFLGEWGDRSQISTIALGAAHVRLKF